MGSAHICPNCGTPLGSSYNGHCSRCLLALALSAGDAGQRDFAPTPALGVPGGGNGPRRLGDYELLEEIGRGGMGIVFKAQQLSLNRLAAVKVLSAGEFANEMDLTRFRREAEAAASLDHPNIVPIYEVGEHQGHHFYSMRLMEGGSLAEEARKAAARHPRVAVQLVAKVARAVQYAHEHGILHRDLKPGNILLDAQGEPCLADFGLAKWFHEDRDLTLSGAILGTVAYLAPEQAASERKVTTASDLYSLGAVFYELLCGHPPFRADTPLEMMRRIMSELPVPPSQIVSDDSLSAEETARSAKRSITRHPSQIDPDLEVICIKCLEKEPRRRYHSAAALAGDLERWLAGQPITARPVGAWERIWLWSRRKPVVAALSASVIVLVLGIAVGSPIALYRINRERRATQRQEILTRRHAYAADMMVASYAAREGLFGRTRELLHRYQQSTSPNDIRGVEWSFLEALTQGPGITLWTSPNPIKYFAAAGPDRWLVQEASGSNWWVAPTGRPTPEFLSVSYRTRLSPSGQFLILQEPFTMAKHLQVWDTRWGVQLFTVRSTWMQTWQRGERIAFAPDESRLYVGQNNGQVSVWDLRTYGEIGARFDAFTNVVEALLGAQIGGVAVSPDNVWLAVSDGLAPRLAIWNIQSHEQVQAKALKDLSQAFTLQFSPAGKTLVTAHLKGELAVWNASNLGRETVLRTNGSFAGAVQFSPDGRWLVAADGLAIDLWTTADWALRGILKGHRARITSLAFDDAGNLMSASEDGSIRRWTIPPRDRLINIEHSIPFADIARWSPGRKALLALDWAGDTIRVWDLGLLKLAGEHHYELGDSVCAAMTDDGQAFAIGHDDGSISVHRAPFDSVRRQSVHAKSLLQLAFSGNGEWLASASYDDTLRLHRVTATGLVEQTNVAFVFQWNPALQFSPDARTLTAWDPTSGNIQVLRVPSLDILTSAQLPSARRGDVFFSPNGQWMAVGTSAGTLRAWDTAGFVSPVQLDPVNLGGIQSLAFSPDSRRLAARLGSHRLLLWDTTTWREVGDFEVPAAVHGVSFAPDGKALVFVDQRRILIWPGIADAKLKHTSSLSAPPGRSGSF